MCRKNWGRVLSIVLGCSLCAACGSVSSVEQDSEESVEEHDSEESVQNDDENESSEDDQGEDVSQKEEGEASESNELSDANENIIEQVFEGVISNWENLTIQTASAYARQIAVGGSHLVAIREDGTVVADGSEHSDYDYGELDVEDWSDIAAIDAGRLITVGLKSDGTVLAAGGYYYGEGYIERYDTSEWTDIVCVAAGYYGVIGVKSDGSVLSVNYSNWGSLLEKAASQWNDIIDAAVGEYHIVGLKSDGTVVAEGPPSTRNELANREQADVDDWTDIVAVAAGDRFTVGLKSNGTVVIAGKDMQDAYGASGSDENDSGEIFVDGWSDIVAIAAGADFVAGLRSDGTVITIGMSEENALEVEGWSNIIAISAGETTVAALCSDGTMLVSGSLSRYSLDLSVVDAAEEEEDSYVTKDMIFSAAVDTESGLSRFATTIAATGNGVLVALKADGTVVCNGSSEDEYDFSSWTDIAALSSGGGVVTGLKNDGTVVTSSSTLDIDDWTDIVAVASGSGFIAGLKSDGTVVAEGENDDGQCDVEDWKNIVMIAAGTNHVIGLKADGSIVGTGDNTYKQLYMTKSGSDREYIAVAAGGNNSFLISDTNSLITYGSATLKGSNVAAVSCQGDFAYALHTDGTVSCTSRMKSYEGIMIEDDWAEFFVTEIASGGSSVYGRLTDGSIISYQYSVEDRAWETALVWTAEEMGY